MAWQLITIDSIENRDLAAGMIARLGFEDIQLDPLQNFQWLLDNNKLDSDLIYCGYEDQTGNKGHCFLRRQFRPVKLSFGEVGLYRYPLQRFELWSEPVLICNESDARQRIMNAFVQSVLALLGQGDGLSIEGLPLESAFYSAVTAGIQESIPLQLGAPYMHQSINFPDSIEGYFQQMSSRSRKSVQYSYRKLGKEFDVELFTCDEAQHIETFLDYAISISMKTYQWNLLGLGLRDRNGLRHTLQKWNRLGGLRSYILLCDGIPVAFMLGHIYHSCYYYIDVGYDPDWGQYSVGSVLQLHVIEQLYGLSSVPKTFDFSVGYGEHKARFGNHQQEEVNMLLMPATMRNRIFVWLYSSLEWWSDSIISLLDRLGVKKRLKKLIRQFSSNKS
ncbi:hypothetical protein GCM10009092_37430 [Bowmanella denitrificans]|uniref:BioF2-like acetyltransferase domain-containing protein n=1 Tax=Bowmanella denitrificans TaxID=366582 RepID=A0ABP3HIT8_9ALTE